METIGNLEVERESTVVIYDVHTGRIIHGHGVVTFKGGKHPDEKTLERDALHSLSLAQPGIRHETAILHVDVRSFKPGTLYKVDVTQQTLVALGSHPPRRKG